MPIAPAPFPRVAREVAEAKRVGAEVCRRFWGLSWRTAEAPGFFLHAGHACPATPFVVGRQTVHPRWRQPLPLTLALGQPLTVGEGIDNPDPDGRIIRLLVRHPLPPALVGELFKRAYRRLGRSKQDA